MVGVLYTKKEYPEIFKKELLNGLEQGLISRQEDFERYIANREDISNFYVMILSVVAEAVDNLYDDLDNEYYSNKVDYAVKSDMDDLGLLLNCSRPEGTRSAVKVTFTLSQQQVDEVHIPAGIVVNSTNGLSFRTSEELYFGDGETIKTITALCTVKGSSNQTMANTVTVIESDLSDYITGSITVNNLSSSFGGSDPFDDADYRTLLKNWILKNQKGNLSAYEEYLENVDGLESYALAPLWDGSGTIKLILECDESDEIMNEVWEGVNSEVIEATEDIVLATPEKIPIDVSTTVDVNIDRVNPFSEQEMEDIKSQIEAAINHYIHGGMRVNGKYFKGLTIGMDFVPFQLARFVSEEVPLVQNMEFDYPSTVITIDSDEIGVPGDITIEMR